LARQDEGGAGAGRAAVPGGHLDHVLGYVVRRTQLAIFNDFKKVFGAFDLRPSQYAVLTLLQERPGLKQSHVGALLGIKRANFVALIDGLEKRGLAVRQSIPEDRRSYALSLTASGEAFLTRMRALNDETEGRLAAHLGPGGHEQLLDLLHRLNDALATDMPGAETFVEPDED
jgi:DNA-binding MarR family transcriptional regulator